MSKLREKLKAISAAVSPGDPATGSRGAPAQSSLDAEVVTMGAEQAAKTLAQVKVAALKREGKTPGANELAAIERQIAAEYDAKSDAYYATSELWDDGILDPVDTRNALGVALSVALNRSFEPGRYGVLRI